MEYQKQNAIGALNNIFLGQMTEVENVFSAPQVKSNPQMANRVWINRPSKFNPHFIGGDFHYLTFELASHIPSIIPIPEYAYLHGKIDITPYCCG